MSIPQAMLTEVSRIGYDQGWRVLQGVRFADTDAAHVACLLDFMAPPRNTVWADIGCGFGEVARLMCESRPDLDFVLVNNNAFQLAAAPTGFRKLHGDMHALPLHDAAVDGCMFLYSLCHADPVVLALKEAARVTAPGGGLFVFDYARLAGDNHLMREKLYASAIASDHLRAIAEAVGWHVTDWDTPDGDDTLFRSLFDKPVEYELIFSHLVPVLWKAVRQ